MAPQKSSIVRAILDEVPAISSHNMESCVISHQKIHSRLMKADTHASTEASTYAAHMNRLLDGLSTEQQRTINYLMSTWEDRRKASVKEMFRVWLKHYQGFRK